jgi:hypothetical protein
MGKIGFCVQRVGLARAQRPCPSPRQRRATHQALEPHAQLAARAAADDPDLVGGVGSERAQQRHDLAGGWGGGVVGGGSGGGGIGGWGWGVGGWGGRGDKPSAAVKHAHACTNWGEASLVEPTHLRRGRHADAAGADEGAVVVQQQHAAPGPEIGGGRGSRRGLAAVRVAGSVASVGRPGGAGRRGGGATGVEAEGRGTAPARDTAPPAPARWDVARRMTRGATVVVAPQVSEPREFALRRAMSPGQPMGVGAVGKRTTAGRVLGWGEGVGGGLVQGGGASGARGAAGARDRHAGVRGGGMVVVVGGGWVGVGRRAAAGRGLNAAAAAGPSLHAPAPHTRGAAPPAPVDPSARRRPAPASCRVRKQPRHPWRRGDASRCPRGRSAVNRPRPRPLAAAAGTCIGRGPHARRLPSALQTRPARPHACTPARPHGRLSPGGPSPGGPVTRRLTPCTPPARCRPPACGSWRPAPPAFWVGGFWGGGGGQGAGGWRGGLSPQMASGARRARSAESRAAPGPAREQKPRGPGAHRKVSRPRPRP